MNILQICPDYYNTKLYENLFLELRKQDIKNYIYVPTNNKNNKKIENIDRDEAYFIPSFNNFDRLSFFSKQKKIMKKLIEEVNIENIDLVHAHTLFSSGYLAYKLNEKYGIPYIVAIRNTDLNVFFKYMIHLRSLGVKIMKNAKKIIFISPKYKDIVLEKYVDKESMMSIKDNIEVIPNGIDEFWHKNKRIQLKKDKFDKLNLIYVGEVNKNKNIVTTIKAIEILREKGILIKFNVIGKISDTKVYDYICKFDFVNYYKPLNKEELIQKYRENDIFVMPSIHETFGLVYAEAMSQGIPIIYSKNQGFDKQFIDGIVGFSVNSLNENEIVIAIENIIKNYSNISVNCVNKVKKFNWSDIEKIYRKTYIKILKERGVNYERNIYK